MTGWLVSRGSGTYIVDVFGFLPRCFGVTVMVGTATIFGLIGECASSSDSWMARFNNTWSSKYVAIGGVGIILGGSLILGAETTLGAANFGNFDFGWTFVMAAAGLFADSAAANANNSSLCLFFELIISCVVADEL